MGRLITLGNAVLATALTAAAFTSQNAEAGLILRLQEGANIQNITDNGAGDSDPNAGIIANITTVGDFSVVITIATSNSPGSSFGLLQMQSLDVRNNAAGQRTLRIDVSDTNFTQPVGPAMTLNSSFGGTFFGSPVGDSITFQSFADPANGQPANAVATPLQAFVATGIAPDSFNSSVQTNWIRGGGPYSLANQAFVTLSANAQANISGTTTAVPEPGAIALGSLAAMALLARRRNA